MTYRMLINLADVLRANGLKVNEVDGWKTRGRPQSTGEFDPVGVLCHHTATPASASDAAVIRLLVIGRSDLPGPLAQLGLGRDGTVHVIAAGRANHAGQARTSGTVAAGDGNRLYIGVEAFNDGRGEPWPQAQYEAYVKLCAVLSVKVTGNSVNTVRGHKETSVTGKIDPTFDMGEFRDRVQAEMLALTRPPKPPKPPRKRNVHVLIGGDWNEPGTSVGKYSALWIAKRGGMQVYSAVSPRFPNGGIDYVLSSAPVTDMRRVGRADSDHPCIEFTVTNPDDPSKVLKGAIWNVRRDRTREQRASLLTFLEHTGQVDGVDFFLLQEARQYHDLLTEVDGYSLLAATEPAGVEHNVILVRDGVTASSPRFRLTSSTGWFTKAGKSHDPTGAALVTLNGWLRVASVHEVVSTDLRGGRWIGPARRVAARISSARTLAQIAHWWKVRR